ncbi:hypothetical protein [Butyrivibrio sp. AE3009]|uniref:hypothetical protein n=1 Tax=Butyrivibrio sp. AE3009 TaxID=1280666 RepID=UPI0003B65835|nr:hypothetical protein [Butyrivibrio sp. AE3009]
MLELKGINTDAEKEWKFVRDMPVDENGLTNLMSGDHNKNKRVGLMHTNYF